MAECHHCKTAIRGESGLMCEGVCKKIYHNAKKCSGVDQYARGILESGGFIRFICDECLQYIHNVDLVIGDIQNNVKKNNQNLDAYKGEFKEALKENEREIKQLLQDIEERYNERLKKLDEAQKFCNLNVQEIRKLYDTANNHENSNKICNLIEERNIKICNEIKKVIAETNAKQQKQVSYSEEVKKTIVMPDLKRQIPIIVKPKEKQGDKKTKEELNKKVDPSNLKITNIESRKNGTVFIQTENDEEREKIKNAIQNEMSGDYEIKIPNPKDLIVDIKYMSFKYSELEIIEKMKKQNVFLKDSNMKIIKTYEYKRNDRIIYNAKIATDSQTYTKLINEQKVNIGWERCKVIDGTDVLQCFKCKGFNHLAKECKNNETCFKCHGNHKYNECKNEAITKCINCKRVNNKLNMGLDVDHLTNDRNCPVYQNKLKNKKRKMGLTC